jgi:hypothetical protein
MSYFGGLMSAIGPSPVILVYFVLFIICHCIEPINYPITRIYVPSMASILG